MLTISAETVTALYWQGLTIDALTARVYASQRGARDRLDRRACREYVERAILASVRSTLFAR